MTLEKLGFLHFTIQFGVTGPVTGAKHRAFLTWLIGLLFLILLVLRLDGKVGNTIVVVGILPYDFHQYKIYVFSDHLV